jgi:hypothetical protein
MIVLQSRPGRIQTFSKEGANKGTQTQICIIRYSTSQFHKKYYFGQEEEEMKLCLMILSVPWYMFNGLEHTAILSLRFTFITGSSSRLLRIRFSAAATLYWFPVCHFRCKEFNPLVIWIWNQYIAISTIVGTSSHNMIIGVT